MTTRRATSASARSPTSSSRTTKTSPPRSATSTRHRFPPRLPRRCGLPCGTSRMVRTVRTTARGVRAARTALMARRRTRHGHSSNRAIQLTRRTARLRRRRTRAASTVCSLFGPRTTTSSAAATMTTARTAKGRAPSTSTTPRRRPRKPSCTPRRCCWCPSSPRCWRSGVHPQQQQTPGYATAHSRAQRHTQQRLVQPVADCSNEAVVLNNSRKRALYQDHARYTNETHR
mmetsp:Transcript_16534/g.57803  ORF Transcript_16534/g.57803 Transcript_16534/m.57803 type:complete len:230 (+) Transcript_16534:424-1113(+)